MKNEKVRLPFVIYNQLNIKKRESLKRNAKITFYKNQAIVHFPSIITSELGLKPNDEFEITLQKTNPLTVICRLKRSKIQ